LRIALVTVLLSALASAATALAQEPPEPPEVTIQAFLDQEGLKHGETGRLTVILANGSATPLTDVRLTLDSPAVAGIETTAALVPPFGDVTTTWEIAPASDARYGKHTLLITARYRWAAEEASFESSRTTTATLSVQRQLESELGGLALGGAAAFYFLLPFIPAVTSYHVGQRLRKGEGWGFPEFGTKVIAPALIACIAVNLLFQAVILPRFGLDFGSDFLEPETFFLIVGTSLVAGAIIPFVMWLWDRYQSWAWDYRGDEGKAEILRKALTGPRAAREFPLVNVAVGAEKWSGLLLAEGTAWFVLAAQLGATVAPAAAVPDNGFDENGQVRDAKKVIELVKSGRLTVSPLVNIEHREQPRDELIVRRETTHTAERADTKPLIKLVK
jgi:hypothetical protein